jgi:TonB family protein
MKTIKEIFICSGLAFATLLILISYQYGCKQKQVEQIVDINKLDSLQKSMDFEDSINNINDSSNIIISDPIEQLPVYKEGDDALFNFLKKELKYPELARKKGIEGTVYVTFVIEKTGDVTGVKVLRGIGYGCDEEAIRVVKKMPKWKPGQQNGKTVKVQCNLPIKFSLDTKKR